MKNKAIRMFTATLAAVLCMAAVSVTAYAGGVDPSPAAIAGGNGKTHHRGDRDGAGGRTRHTQGQCGAGG